MKKYTDNVLFNLNSKFSIISGGDILVFSLKLVLIILLLFMNDTAILAILMPVILIPGILFNYLTTNKYYWLILSLFSGICYLVLDLIGYVPNHKHIFAYVVIAITLILFLAEKQKQIGYLKIQARYIIGLCFLFAVIGKFLAPEFIDGSFFEFTNTADPRFFGFTSFTADVDFNLLIENEINIHNLMNTANLGDTFVLNGVKNLGNKGVLVSYWTIFIEGMIAISFCLPSKFLVSKIRNIFLIAFILSTYPIATVAGFAIILTVLGFIQSLKNNKLSYYSLFYLLVFIALPLIKIPFLRVLNIIF